MRPIELRGRDPEELERDLKELKQELFSLDFEWQSEENPDSNKKRKIRKDIARIKTILREKELEAETAAE